MSVTLREGPENITWSVPKFARMIETGILQHKVAETTGGAAFLGTPYIAYTELLEGQIVRNTRRNVSRVLRQKGESIFM